MERREETQKTRTSTIITPRLREQWTLRTPFEISSFGLGERSAQYFRTKPLQPDPKRKVRRTSSNPLLLHAKGNMKIYSHISISKKSRLQIAKLSKSFFPHLHVQYLVKHWNYWREVGSHWSRTARRPMLPPLVIIHSQWGTALQWGIKKQAAVWANGVSVSVT